MKIAWLVTSAIEVTDRPLTYTNTRSVFNSQERLQQTDLTITSIKQLNRNSSFIYLLDTGINFQTYQDYFLNYTNLKYIPTQKHFPDIFQEVIDHPNKSRCESLMTKYFLDHYHLELLQYDAIMKISGRYFIDNEFDLNSLNRDQLFFKYPWISPWQDFWGYQEVREKESNVLRQYCSALYGWGINQYDNVLKLYKIISDMLAQKQYHHYDMETLLYFFSRSLADDIVEVSWPVYGWNSPSGRFVKW